MDKKILQGQSDPEHSIKSSMNKHIRFTLERKLKPLIEMLEKRFEDGIYYRFPRVLWVYTARIGSHPWDLKPVMSKNFTLREFLETVEELDKHERVQEIIKESKELLKSFESDD